MDSILLELFRSYYSDKENYVSGEELGEKIGISRAAIWKRVEALKERGFSIEPLQKKGYRLTAFPVELLIPEAVDTLFSNLMSGKKVPDVRFVYLPETASTNTYAKKLVTDNPGGTVVVMCDQQTAGRGRLKRVWTSEKGLDLAFTIGIPLDCEISEYFKYSIVAASAVQKSLSNYSDGFLIKWPNDIYAAGKKICGILSETLNEQNRIQNLIVGIGINVNSRPAVPNAVSLSELAGKDVDRNFLLATVLYEFFNGIEEAAQDYAKTFKYWKTRLMGLNRSVRFETGRETIEGVLTDIGMDGSIEIERDGKTAKYYSGDLYVL